MDYTIECKSPKQRKLLEFAMPKLIKLLKLDRYKALVFIYVDSDYGDNNGAQLSINDMQFVVLKAGQAWHEVLTALCHEMVHVKQKISGVFQEDAKGHIWKGKRVPAKTAYLDKPWEKQAFMLESWLTRKVME